MTEEQKEILREEYIKLKDIPLDAVADHIYFNIILSEEFEDVEDELLDNLKEWYSDYEFYVNSGADEEELNALILEVLDEIKEFVSED